MQVGLHREGGEVQPQVWSKLCMMEYGVRIVDGDI